jgi:hypothetical protein
MQQRDILLDTELLSDELAEEFGPLLAGEIQFLIRRGIVMAAPAPELGLSENQVVNARSFIRDLREAGLSGRLLVRGEQDERERLIAELRTKAFPGEPAHRSLSVSSYHEGIGFPTGAPPSLIKPVMVTFDATVPRRTLFRWLQEIWPELKRSGIVRQTRPLSARNAELIRLVCLHAPDKAWSARFPLWNEKHPEWAYQTTKEFTTDFFDAVEALTGDRRGLTWFLHQYERKSPTDLLSEAPRDPSAAKELKRRRELGWKAIRNSGVDFVDQRSTE